MKRAVVLSSGAAVDGDDVGKMLKLQHKILLNLSKKYPKLVVLQRMVADANLLGLEVAERFVELHDHVRDNDEDGSPFRERKTR